jgi:hypothetical protein
MVVPEIPLNPGTKKWRDRYPATLIFIIRLWNYFTSFLSINFHPFPLDNPLLALSNFLYIRFKW